MKALSIHNPFAQLIVRGLKPLEIRKKPTTYRGEILICVTQKQVYTWEINPNTTIKEFGNNVNFLYEHKGHAIGIVTITDCRKMTKADEELACCEYQEGLYAYVLENPFMLKTPFPVKGQLGWFNVDIAADSDLFYSLHRI